MKKRNPASKSYPGISYHGGAERYHVETANEIGGQTQTAVVVDTADSMKDAKHYFERAIRLAFDPDIGQSSVHVWLLDKGRAVKYSEVGPDGAILHGDKKRNPSSEGRIVRRVVTVSNPSNPSKLRPWMEGDVLGTLKHGHFLYHMGNYVYVAYLNTDSEPPVIQGKRISEFEYTNLLDWNRANVYNMHGTNVITVPWAGGTREFTFRGDERFPVIETGPETHAPKEKKVKGIERYKKYYINSFGRGKWYGALDPSAVASEKAAKEGADYGPRPSLPDLKAYIDEYGGLV